MFGKRAIASPGPEDKPRAPMALTPKVPAVAAKVVDHAKPSAPVAAEPVRSEEYYVTKSMIFGALDRGDRSVAAVAPRSRVGARRDPRHRPGDHLDQERRDVDRRAGRSAQRHLQRRARLRPARAAARTRRHRRHHGERRDAHLHRGRRQDPADQHPLPRQRAAHEHLPAHRQPGRPPRRRGLADLRRAPRRRLARQRHRAAARHRRARSDHPKVPQGQADARPAAALRRDLRRRRRDPEDHRQGALQRRHLRRHRLRQDDAAQLPDELHRGRRAGHHLRGRGRAPAAAGRTWCGSKHGHPTSKAPAR